MRVIQEQEFKYKVNRQSWIGVYYSQLLSLIARKWVYCFFIQAYQIWAYTQSWNLINLIRLLKNNSITSLDALLDIVVIDNPESTYGRFGLAYTFWSYKRGLRFFVKTFASSDTPIVSLGPIFPSSGWLEREAWDMFGIKFLGHEDLRRILTDYGFKGHPLRKDFPLMGFVEIRYDDSYRCLIFEPVELTQEFRFFKFESTWTSIWAAK